MGHTLEQFSAECHRLLAAEPGPAGRRNVVALLEEVLRDDAFVSAHVGDDVPERKILYEDPDLGFCILAHVYRGARESQPHDHGPSWAIYGQARGETTMNDWEVVEPAAEGKPGKARLLPARPPLSPAGRHGPSLQRGRPAPSSPGWADPAHPNRGDQHGPGEAAVLRAGLTAAGPGRARTGPRRLRACCGGEIRATR